MEPTATGVERALWALVASLIMLVAGIVVAEVRRGRNGAPTSPVLRKLSDCLDGLKDAVIVVGRQMSDVADSLERSSRNQERQEEEWIKRWNRSEDARGQILENTVTILRRTQEIKEDLQRPERRQLS